MLLNKPKVLEITDKPVAHEVGLSHCLWTRNIWIRKILHSGVEDYGNP